MCKMHKRINIKQPPLIKLLDELSATNLKGNNAISVYTNEFDLSLIKVFHPTSTVRMGYIQDSIAIVDGKYVQLDTVKNHNITIITRGNTFVEKNKEIFSKITEHGDFKILYLDPKYLISKKDEEPKDEEPKDEDNQLIKCNYTNTLFPPGVDFSKLQMTSIGVYSMTSYKSNLQIITIIKNIVGKDIKIMDSTACVGGDTIGFGMNFKSVVSIEKDLLNYNVLVNNISAYGLKNIETINSSFNISIVENTKPDVVYFDPPWGGKDYKSINNLDLFLNGENIIDIVKKLGVYKFIKLIVLKVPTNFNSIGINDLGKTDFHTLKKFNLFTIIPS